jgi:hypothetical protein
MQAVLGSWKEIARYLGKGVRTVQRWERQSALPVHRPSGSRKGVVLAFPAELDKWARGSTETISLRDRTHLRRNTALSAQLIQQTHLLRVSTMELVKRCNAVLELSKRRNSDAQKLLHEAREQHRLN